VLMAKPKNAEATTKRTESPPDVREAFEQFERDRRSVPRIPARFSVHFESGPAFTKAFAAYTSNIGMGGLCLLTQNAYEIGTPLRLKIDVSSKPTFEVDGTVAWQRKGIAIGVRFENMTKEDQATLHDIVQVAMSGK
jgi:uncharacterized protein (TIGR02266 family)